MTLPEFNAELREVLKVFEKEPNDEYLKILFRKLEDLSLMEFRAIKMRVFEECENFPKIAKWVSLAYWIKDKRNVKPINVEYKNCETCLSTGFIHVQLGASKTFVHCACEMGTERHVEGIPTIEETKAAKIIPWRLSDFKPTAERSFENLSEGFRETVNIAQQFWAHNRGAA